MTEVASMNYAVNVTQAICSVESSIQSYMDLSGSTHFLIDHLLILTFWNVECLKGQSFILTQTRVNGIDNKPYLESSIKSR